MLRVVIAEDDVFLREGLVQLLAQGGDLEVAAACGDRDSLEAAVAEHQPAVVLTDIRMPPTRRDEGIQAARTWRRTQPRLGVVVLSQYADPEYALALLEGGAGGRGYLLKERISDPEQVRAAIRDVARGGSVVDAKVVESLVAASGRQKGSPLAQLTPRERQVLEHLARGESNMAIARALVLSERAVEKHINSIFGKLGLAEEPDTNRRVCATLLYLAEN